MTWNFNMDEAPKMQDVWVATSGELVAVGYKNGHGKWNRSPLIAWCHIEKPKHPRATSTEHAA